jgi:hypothetical protein
MGPDRQEPRFALRLCIALLVVLSAVSGCGEPPPAPVLRGAAQMTVAEWKRFLDTWSQEALTLVKQGDPSYRSDLARRALQRGTLTFPGATEEEIAATEQRLGTPLPESYRRFLQASNGFVVIALDVDDAPLWPAESLRWLKDGEPDFLRAWTADPYSVSNADYFRYGPDQDPVHIRTRYLPDMLQLSPYVEAAVLLMNPRIRTQEGEWEGWDMGDAYPGAFRFQSFERLMQGLRNRTLANLQDAIAFEQRQE